MSTLTRVTGKVFAGNAESSQVGQFGSAAANNPTNTTDVATIQALDAYDEGWGSAVISNRNYPPLEEVNGVLKTISYQTCYLLQEGLPTYDSGTNYSATSIVKSFSENGIEFYRSKRDNNKGKALSNTTYWQLITFPTGYESNITANRSISLTGAVTGSVNYQLTDSNKYALSIATSGQIKSISLTGAVTGNATINTGNNDAVSISTAIPIPSLFKSLNADFSRGTTMAINVTHTATSDGFINWVCNEKDTTRDLKINDVTVARVRAAAGDDDCGTAAFLPVVAGWTYWCNKGSLAFYPLFGE